MCNFDEHSVWFSRWRPTTLFRAKAIFLYWQLKTATHETKHAHAGIGQTPYEIRNKPPSARSKSLLEQAALYSTALLLRTFRSKLLVGRARKPLGARNHCSCFEATYCSQMLLEQASLLDSARARSAATGRSKARPGFLRIHLAL